MKKIGLYILSLGMMFTSCQDWLDINHDPNNATQEKVSKELLLTGMLDYVARYPISTADAMYAHYVSKSGSYSGTYVSLTGIMTPQNFDDYWSANYSYVANLKVVKEKAIEDKDPAIEGIATLLIVQCYQRLVDVYNDVPYTESALGGENISPKYDKAEDIYNDLLVKCDEAIASISKAIADPGSISPQLKKADIMCKGNMNQWLRFAHTLKLNLLMRMSNVKDVSAQVAALEGKCLNIDELIEVNPGYYKEPKKMNPLYSSWGYNSLDNVTGTNKEMRPTSSLVDFLRDNADPRLRVYISPRLMIGNPTDGTADYTKYGLENEWYIGVPYGWMNPPTHNYLSGVCIGVLGRSVSFKEAALSSLIIRTGSEVGFFMAEAALRGMIPGGDAAAKDYYEKAVIASIARHETVMKTNAADFPYKNGVAPAIEVSAKEAARQYLDQDNAKVNWDKMTTFEQKMEAICTQKWLNLFMVDHTEAWSELRRTDYPRLGRSVSSTHQKLISRFLYPQTEINLNESNVKAQGEVDIHESLIFWDKENNPAPETEVYL